MSNPLLTAGLAQAGTTFTTGPNWGTAVGSALYDPYNQIYVPSHQHTMAYPYPQPATPTNIKVIANLRIEQIENGYLVIYSKQGVPEERRFAKDMREVGDAVIAACTKLQLTPPATK